MYNIDLLKHEMKRKGFSNYTLGRAARVNEKTVSKLMATGEVKSDCLYRIARRLGFPVTQRKVDDGLYVYDFSAIMRESA